MRSSMLLNSKRRKLPPLTRRPDNNHNLQIRSCKSCKEFRILRNKIRPARISSSKAWSDLLAWHNNCKHQWVPSSCVKIRGAQPTMGETHKASCKMVEMDIAYCLTADLSLILWRQLNLRVPGDPPI